MAFLVIIIARGYFRFSSATDGGGDVLVWAGTDGEGGNSSTPDGEHGGVDAQQHDDSDEDGDAAIKMTFTKIDCVKVQGGGVPGRVPSRSRGGARVPPF